MATPRFFTLSQITARIAEIFAPHLGRTFWVRGEISSGRERGGSFYFDLVETGAGGLVTAKVACTLWSRDLALIRRKFEGAGLTLKLDDGTEVGLLCSLQYDPRYGLSFKAQDADPAFALGELELRRRAILLRLEKEGLFEPNKRLAVPQLPQRIGVITSRSSAAFSDFIKTLTVPAFGFRILVADALMQGAQTEGSILRALDALERLGPDLVVVIRGGGSRTELAALDSEAVARRIAACRIPVWTGIGHETDESVLDFVANRRHKTPTAVAEAILDRFIETARHLETARARFGTTWSYRLQMEQRRLERDRTGVRQGTRKLIDVSLAQLEQRRQALNQIVQRRLAAERADHAASRREFVAASRSLLRAEAERLQTARGRFRTAWSYRGEMERRRLERDRVGVRQGARKITDVARAELAGRRHLLSGAARASLGSLGGELGARRSRFVKERFLRRAAAEGERLASKGMSLRLADPAQNLKRGFALVYDRAGRVVTSVRGLSRGEALRTRVGDGTIASTVESVEGDG
jgi:exodeoxyribonuclease VII large subunit